MQLLVDVMTLEERKGLGLGVVELDPVGQLGADAGHVVPHLFVEVGVVDHHTPVVPVELLADDPDGGVGLAVQQ